MQIECVLVAGEGRPLLQDAQEVPKLSLVRPRRWALQGVPVRSLVSLLTEGRPQRGVLPPAEQLLTQRSGVQRPIERLLLAPQTDGWQSICGSMRQELHRQRTVSQGLQTGRGDARRVARARGTVLRVLEQQGCEASTHGREKPPSPLVVPWWRKCKKAGEAKRFGDRRLRATWKAVCHEWTPRLSRNTCCTKASLPKGAPSTSNPC